MKKQLSHILSGLFGLLWIISGVLKAWDPDTFYFALSGYKIFPVIIKWLVVFYYPSLEIILGIFFIFSSELRKCYLITLNLLVFFIILLFVTWLRGLQVNCGCFSTGVTPSNIMMRMLQDIALFILALWGLKLSARVKKTQEA